jgi:hypothetical protein
VAALGNLGRAGVITQDLGFVPLPNTTYTLTVYVGQRADYAFGTYAAELLVGTTSVASDTTHRPGPGTFVLDTVIYNSGSSPGTGHLSIRLTGSGGGQADFAQVALTATSVGPVTKILPQLAFGGGWYTALYFTNISGTPVSFTVNSIGNDGNGLSVPAVGGSSAPVNLAARGTALIEIPDNGPLVQGYVSAGLTHRRHRVRRLPPKPAPGQCSRGRGAAIGDHGHDQHHNLRRYELRHGRCGVNLAAVNNTITATARDNNGNTLGHGHDPAGAQR